MTDYIEGPTPAEPTPTAPRKRRLSVQAALVATALLAVGVGGGATVAQMTGPTVEMAPATPTAIRTLSDGESIVTVRGKVAEVYGAAFIMADASGRALIETGPRHGFMGNASPLVSVGQTVTVQGRFRDGTVHASFLVGADGKVMALRPMGPPRGGPGGPGGRHGPHGGPGGPEGRGPDRGPDGGPDDGPDGGPDGAGAPPPPPPAAAAVTANSAG
ncbi:hypothetical protein AB5I39_04460 [Sphingomonas sp. MMS24-J45]|uniref:hypothetical protein n=1 Tax=Sphingomonas sp. MMS24-J45 TaxID=3238806 RepID=UPI0038505E7F